MVLCDDCLSNILSPYTKRHIFHSPETFILVNKNLVYLHYGSYTSVLDQTTPKKLLHMIDIMILTNSQVKNNFKK